MSLASTVYHPMGCTPDSCTPTIRFTQLYWFHPPSVWRKQKTDFFTSALISIPPVSSGAHLRTSASCFCVSNVSFQLVFPSALNIYFDLIILKKKKKKTWPTFHSILFSFIVKPLESFTDACLHFLKFHLLYNPLWFGWHSLPTPTHYHQSCSGKAIYWDFCCWIQ